MAAVSVKRSIVNVNESTVLFCFPFYVGTRKCTFKEKEWCEEERTEDSWKEVHMQMSYKNCCVHSSSFKQMYSLQCTARRINSQYPVPPSFSCAVQVMFWIESSLPNLVAYMYGTGHGNCSIYTRVNCVQCGGFTRKMQLLQQLHKAYVTCKVHAFSIVGKFPLYFYTQAACFFLSVHLKKIVSLISWNHFFSNSKQVY